MKIAMKCENFEQVTHHLISTDQGVENANITSLFGG
jgi:hypothetical protein